jgi:hypothetical protein
LQSCGPSHPPAASMSAHAQDKSAPCPEESGPVNIICSGAAAYTSAESAPETGEETFSEVQESFEARGNCCACGMPVLLHVHMGYERAGLSRCTCGPFFHSSSQSSTSCTLQY